MRWCRVYVTVGFILALDVASPGNQHYANCIGTLSFPLILAAVAAAAAAAGTVDTHWTVAIGILQPARDH